MKTQYFVSARILRATAATLILPFQMLPVAEGATVPQDIEVADIARLCVRVCYPGEIGLGHVIGTEGDTRYEIDGSELRVYLAPVDRLGDMSVIVDGAYGQVCLHAVISLTIATDGVAEVELTPYTFAAIAAGGGGGGGDYKTDIYMDGAGRVILERFEDGSTIIYDEHENPIVKRNADGSTQYFDAYQSARLLIDANGAVLVHDDTAGTLAIADAILARTRKHLLQYDGGANIKDEDGNVLTHADIYAMLMESPDFVVLVHADHAYHPNLVTPTQIAFTCSYASTNGDIVVERVNITNTNQVTKLTENAVTRNSVGGVAIGLYCTASGENSHAEGQYTTASGSYSHAEGSSTMANGSYSHAEGNGYANGVGSHAEGVFTNANGEYSHAEGGNTNAKGEYSHAEGNSTIAKGSYSHAEGIYNNPDDANVEGSFAHGCGTSDSDRKNSVLFVGEKVYILGVGGYDGTNHKSAKDLATVVAGL